jgi:patatin-related protein
VVDTIAGTSAGGINGLFLAKALANGQEFAPLKQLWITEGDIDALLNDQASYKDIKFAETDSPPQSLLNSDRMYVKLLEALRGMEPAIPPIANGESALVDEIDLYVTTTDIRGAVVPLRLFDKVVYEKRYKQVYHFQYASGKTSHNDLADANSPFLAFAARCTSSFPFAFEPMCVDDAQRLCDARPNEAHVDFEDWKPFFTGLSTADMTTENWRKRAFGDGGYLDNKPFSYVCEALSWRLGGLPMERKLIYVEPAPSHPEDERQNFGQKPDALQNAFAAIFSIPQDETIRQDLEAVLNRNRRIERVEQIVRQVEADIEGRDDDPFDRIILHEGEVPSWRTRGMNDMTTYYGAAFLPYRRLRIMTVTDDIADRLAVWWGVDRGSDRLYALRAMVRVWRENKYQENRNPDPNATGQKPTVNEFLDDYDVKYRLRRAGFILRKVHQLLDLAAKLKLPPQQQQLSDIETRLLARCRGSELPPEKLISGPVAEALRCLAGGFGDSMGELRDTTWLSAPAQNEVERKAETERKAAADTLDQMLRLLLGEKSGATLKELATPAGVLVPLPVLPPPSPLRTLQENIFERAKSLFEKAALAQKTHIQQLLEADVELLRTEYAKVIHPDPIGGGRALLGNPKLEVKPRVAGAKPKVGIHVDNVNGYDALNTPDGKTVREFVAEYYVRFDEYDQMSFPLYYDTGTGEPATVEVLRVSPEDATSLINERADDGRPKLAGTEYFHFGAFLDEKWRRNDIMWGRLDGCERVLAALFPQDEDVREALLQEAQLIIVREEMQPEQYDQMINSFAQALAQQNASTLGQALNALLAHLGPPGSTARQTQIGRILKALLGDAGTVDYLKQYYNVNRKPDTEKTLKTSARALTITGKILEEAEKRYRSPFSRMVWVTRAGRALQALLTISTPRSLPRAVFRHWLILLYMFEVLIVIGATLFSSQSTLNFGLSALGLTIVLNLATLVTGDLIDRKRGKTIIAAAALSLVVLALAALGTFALFHPVPRGLMCTDGLQNEIPIFQKWCPPP